MTTTRKTKPAAKAKPAAKKPAAKRAKSPEPRKELIVGQAAEASAKRSMSRDPIQKSEINVIRRTLSEQRQQILDAMRRAQSVETEAEVGDEADQAGLSIERELQFELSDNERMTLDQIEGALRKIEKGTYGLCELCRRPVERLRLKALPFARYCIGCQNNSERATATLP